MKVTVKQILFQP